MNSGLTLRNKCLQMVDTWRASVNVCRSGILSNLLEVKYDAKAILKGKVN